jgi:hypothetical protein
MPTLHNISVGCHCLRISTSWWSAQQIRVHPLLWLIISRIKSSTKPIIHLFLEKGFSLGNTLCLYMCDHNILQLPDPFATGLAIGFCLYACKSYHSVQISYTSIIPILWCPVFQQPLLHHPHQVSKQATTMTKKTENSSSILQFCMVKCIGKSYTHIHW